jgi:hypothetical protein
LALCGPPVDRPGAGRDAEPVAAGDGDAVRGVGRRADPLCDADRRGFERRSVAELRVACENGGDWLDSPGYYRCGLQFDPMWERHYGRRFCP